MQPSGLVNNRLSRHLQTNINLAYTSQPGQTNILNDGSDIYTGRAFTQRFGRVIDQNWWVVVDGASMDRFQYGYDANSNVLYKNCPFWAPTFSRNIPGRCMHVALI